MARAVELAPERATVAVTTSTPFIRLLEAQGHGAAEERNRTLRALLARYDVPEETLAAENARLPHDLSLEVLERSAWVLGTNAIALRALGYWRMGDHGIGDYLNATCANLRELLDTVVKHVALLHDGLRFSVRSEDGLTFLTCELHADVTQNSWFVENSLGKLVMELRNVFGETPIPGLVRVHFAHTAPSYEREYAAAFRLPVDFSQGENALVFHTSGLDVPFPSADPVLHTLLLRQAATMLPTRRVSRSLIDRVKTVAREELSTSFGDQSRVAKRLGMSSATLRRKLEQEHSARYTNILSDIRRDIAVTCLAESALSIDEIGRRAGFSQKTAFYRAFKRWLGCTPAEYRHANRVR
ncbi:MAG TPA: AraC family transcriptional regulator ligand-binding domain-containing protein [Polyangiaceae bacterium]|jgi:AraC-like DNA-binding protein|nr:AraC family transcriptional regulator ligand-binding domain-containing protein [Polyangiaceae bacterium]